MKKVVLSLVIGCLSVGSCFADQTSWGVLGNSESGIRQPMSDCSQQRRDKGYSRNIVSRDTNSASAEKAAMMGVALTGGVALAALTYCGYKASSSLFSSAKTVIAENINVASALNATKSVGTSIEKAASVAGSVLWKTASAAGHGLSWTGKAFWKSCIGSAKLGYKAGSTTSDTIEKFVRKIPSMVWYNAPKVIKGLHQGVSGTAKIIGKSVWLVYSETAKCTWWAVSSCMEALTQSMGILARVTSVVASISEAMLQGVLYAVKFAAKS